LATGYFASQGFDCPKNKNPADYFMSLLSEASFKKVVNTTKTYSEFINGLGDLYEASDLKTKIEINQEMPELTDEYIVARKYEASWFRQFFTLYKRANVNCSRQMMDNVLRFITVIVLSLFILALYYDVRNFLNYF
jgi:hypothetical protein